MALVKPGIIEVKTSIERGRFHAFSTILKCLALVLLITSSFSLQAQDQDQKDRKIYVELKPFQFISGGYSVVGHYALKENWHLGANIFSSELSVGLHNLVFNFGEAIDLQANQSLAINVSARYFLNKNKGAKGWVVSIPLGYEWWNLTDLNTEQEVGYEYLYLSPRIGYLWYPFKKERFYLIGEVIGVLPIFTDGEVALGNSTIELRSFFPIPGFALGYRF